MVHLPGVKHDSLFPEQQPEATCCLRSDPLLMDENV